MSHYKFCVASTIICVSLVACGETETSVARPLPVGEDLQQFNANRVDATGQAGENLTSVERDDRGTPSPTDDVRTNVGGFAITSDGGVDPDVTSQTSQTTAGPITTITVLDSNFVISGTNSRSDDGALEVLDTAGVVGEQSAAGLFAFGANLSDGQSDQVLGYVRGLATPNNDIRGTGRTTYTGRSFYVSEGSVDPQEGDFSIETDFQSSAISGQLDVGAAGGMVSGGLTGSAFAGTVSVGADTLQLIGNIYGSNASEIAGAATGSVGGVQGVVIFQGEN